MHTPPAIIARWASNPDAPRLTDRHRSFLTYLWSSGGEPRAVDEYSVEVEVDPQFGNGRDEYAAQIGVHPSTVSRWAHDLKAHGLLAQRKTKRRERHPLGEGRTVWIVRLPLNAVEGRREADRTRYSDIRDRRDQIRAAREGGGEDPAPRSKDYRAARSGVLGHTVQEATSHPCEVLPTSHQREVLSTSHQREVLPTSHQREVDRGRTSERTTSEGRTSEEELHAGGVTSRQVRDIAVRVLKDRIGLDAKMAHAFCNDLGGRACLVLAHCFLHGKMARTQGAGAGLFVWMVQDIESSKGDHRDHLRYRHSFQYRTDSGTTIRPSNTVVNLEEVFNDGTLATRYQTVEDFERLANGGSLRTTPSTAPREQHRRPLKTREMSY